MVFSIFFIVEFLLVNWLLRSVICSEIVSKVSANCSLASPVAEDICCSMSFFSTFKSAKRSSAAAFNL